MPVAPAGPEPPPDVWAEGERLENRQHDLPAAAAFFEKGSRHRSAEIRAGALLRLARVQRKRHQTDRAMATYRALAELDVAVAGEPAALRARRALGALLAEAGQRAVLATEASALWRDLSAGRWPIDRATYRYYVEELSAWTDVSVEPEEPAALASAMDAIWRDSRRGADDDSPRAGRVRWDTTGRR